MGMGYEGILSIGGATALGTGGTVPLQTVRIESPSGYGGTITGLGTLAIGNPRVYDWTIYDGSVDFEATDGVLGVVLGWVPNRNSSMGISLSTRQSNQQLGTAFWNSITLQASSNSLLTGSLGFAGTDRTYTVGVLAQNDVGTGYAGGNPIPYWETNASMGGTSEFLSWSLSFTQDIVRIYTCENSPIVVEPRFLAVGIMNIVFSGDALVGAPNFLTAGTATITMGTHSVGLGLVEINNISDNLTDANSAVPVSFEANAYELSSCG